MPKKDCIAEVREPYQKPQLPYPDSFTDTSYESFNDQALLLHAEEVRPVVELRCCGHLSEHSVE